MKVVILLLSYFVQIATAQTWVIHNVQTTTLSVIALGPQETGFNNGIAWGAVEWHSWATVDYWWETNYQQVVSGTGGYIWNSNTVSFDIVYSTAGYSNTQSFYALGTVDVVYWDISGPGPDYFGDVQGTLPNVGGEFWIDFDPSSSSSVSVGRISTSQPSDFGKYQWDGSINPDYVAPLLTRKHHGKR